MTRSLPLVRHREMSYPHRQMNDKVAIRFHTASGVGRCEKIEPVRPPLLKPFAVSLIFWSPHTWRRMPLWVRQVSPVAPGVALSMLLKRRMWL